MRKPAAHITAENGIYAMVEVSRNVQLLFALSIKLVSLPESDH